MYFLCFQLWSNLLSSSWSCLAIKMNEIFGVILVSFAFGDWNLQPENAVRIVEPGPELCWVLNYWSW